jgi:hypothetical protein
MRSAIRLIVLPSTSLISVVELGTASRAIFFSLVALLNLVGKYCNPGPRQDTMLSSLLKREP